MILRKNIAADIPVRGVILSVLLPYGSFSMSLPTDPCVDIRFLNVGCIFLSIGKDSDGGLQKIKRILISNLWYL